jgi:PAS domain S-box-containing protein
MTPTRSSPDRGGDSDQRLSALHAASPHGIVELDLDRTVLSANAAFLRLLDRPSSEVLGAYGPDLLGPDGAAVVIEGLDELAAGTRDGLTGEAVLSRADGSGVPVRLDWGVVRAQDGRPQRLVCVVTDLTEQILLRAELDRARERAEVLWHKAPVGIIECSADGTVLFANASFAELLGYQPEELVGVDGRSLAVPDSPPDDPEGIDRLLRGESYVVERRYLHKDGRAVSVHTSATALRDASGDVERFAGFVVDLTELRAQQQDVQEALEQVARQRAFMEAVLETVDVGIRFVDADGANLTRNRAERAMSGVPKEHDGGRPQEAGRHSDLLDSSGCPIGPEDLPLVRAMRGEDPERFIGRLGPRGGPHRDVVVRSNRVTAPDGEVLGAVVSLTDITAERTALQALSAERAALAEAQRVGRIGSFSVDPGTGGWTMSDQLYELWGHPVARPGIAELRRQVLDAEPDEVLPASAEGFRTGGRASRTFRLRHAATGEERVLVATTEVTLAEGGAPLSITGTHHDITDLAAAERAATEARAFFEAALVATPDYTFITDLATGAHLYGTPGKTILGLVSEQVQALGAGAISALIHPDDQHRLRALNVASGDLEDGQVLHLQYRARHADGSWRWLSRRVTAFRRDPSGRVTQVLGVVRDVTDVVEAEDRLRHTALHDDLTGLPNRVLLYDRIGEAILRAREAGEELAVLFIDLDGFKRVNDGYGHSDGDEVLRVTAGRLRAVLRKQDTVARFGGDEFVVLVEQAHRLVRDQRTGGTGPPEAAASDHGLSMRAYGRLVAGRLVAAVAEPVAVDGRQHLVAASVGVRIVRPSPTESVEGLGRTAEAVLREADAAMYEAKEQGGSRFVVFDADGRRSGGRAGPTSVRLASLPPPAARGPDGAA